MSYRHLPSGYVTDAGGCLDSPSVSYMLPARAERCTGKGVAVAQNKNAVTNR